MQALQKKRMVIAALQRQLGSPAGARSCCNACEKIRFRADSVLMLRHRKCRIVLSGPLCLQSDACMQKDIPTSVGDHVHSNEANKGQRFVAHPWCDSLIQVKDPCELCQALQTAHDFSLDQALQVYCIKEGTAVIPQPLPMIRRQRHCSKRLDSSATRPWC